MIKPMPMDGEAIAQELGISRQAVSNSLKRGMKKCYKYVRRTWPELSPLAASVFLMKWIDSIGSIDFDDNEITKFNRLYPRDVRLEIEMDINEKRVTSNFITILQQVNEIFETLEFKEVWEY